MTKHKEAKTKFEKGSGNVFADLQILEKRRLKQGEISSILGIAQPNVSHLMNGHYSRFTADKLLDFLKSLNQKVTIQISPHRAGEPYREVEFNE